MSSKDKIDTSEQKNNNQKMIDQGTNTKNPNSDAKASAANKKSRSPK